jgi:hypothetical protein
MTEKKEHTTEPLGRRRGRPRAPCRIARPNRVVTFVTDQELQFLSQTAIEEDRSMASVVHRIIAAQVKED